MYIIYNIYDIIIIHQYYYSPSLYVYAIKLSDNQTRTCSIDDGMSYKCHTYNNIESIYKSLNTRRNCLQFI